MIPAVFRATLCAFALGVLAQAKEVWTTSNLHGSPEPPLPYRLERAFPNITFTGPLDGGTIPGTKRFVVVEQRGKIWTVEDENASAADLLFDAKDFDKEANETYGITFHPKFKENRLAYVWINLDTKGKPNRENGTRIVQFKMLEGVTLKLDVKSGEVIFSWLSGGHNGGSVRFGPDGMLYLSTGDAEAPDPPDGRNTGQDISDVLSSVLRIDVDHREGGKLYGIPRDNPFVNTPGARGEVWAYGFRNPWRMSFDARRGDIWVGDVGWELWEMVHRVERGGNYGWSITEAGKQDVHPNGARGPTPIQLPIVVHSHDEAASITGGEVYYGPRLPELNGAYIYGDWQFGTYWELKFENGRVTEHKEMCHSSTMPAGFGVEANGELIVCDHGGGGLYRFARNPDSGKPSKFPTKLSESGLFADTARQKPAPGVLPYEVNATRWADFGISERWVGLPNDQKIGVAKKEWGVVGPGRWVFPKDAVLALTYSMEMERGNPESRRKIETQIMHFDGLQWGAYSYRWNEAGTDAELVGKKGGEMPLEVKDPEAPGGVRRQNWRFFSRAECLRCHTMWNNFTPGFTGAQLKSDFLNDLVGARSDARPLANPHDTSANLEWRARSYLHVNCSVCHRVSGGGSVRSFMNIEEKLADSRLIEQKPVAGDLGLPEARVIAPGDPARSVLLYRLTTGGRGHMPYLGSKLVHNDGIALIRDWVASLPTKVRLPDTVNEARVREQTFLKSERIDNLLATPTGSLRLALAVVDGSLQGKARAEAIAKGSALADPLRRDLFEHFLPPEQRRKVLGPNINPESILARNGDAAKGKALFTAICATCHRVDELGVEFAPNLSKIAAKYDRAKLLEQVLQPGKIIDPEWFVTTVTFKDDESVSGFIVSRAGNSVTLKIAGGEKRDIPEKEIKNMNTARATLMPEGLLENLSLEEASDLLAFLIARK